MVGHLDVLGGFGKELCRGSRDHANGIAETLQKERVGEEGSVLDSVDAFSSKEHSHRRIIITSHDARLSNSLCSSAFVYRMSCVRPYRRTVRTASLSRDSSISGPHLSPWKSLFYYMAYEIIRPNNQ